MAQGDLNVKLSAETAAYRKGLLDAQKETDKLRGEVGKLRTQMALQDAQVNRSVQHIGNMGNAMKALRGTVQKLSSGIVSLLGIGSVAGITYLIKSSIEAADSINDLADRTGLGIEAFQELRYAATQAGMSQDQFNQSMEFFSKSVGQASMGVGRALRYFRDMGISFRDINGDIRTTEDLFDEAIQKIRQMGSTSEQTAAAMALFGSEEIVNFAQTSAEAIDRLRERAKELGLVLSEDVVKNSGKAADALDTLGQVIRMNLTAAIAENAEELERLTNGLISLFAAIPKGSKTFFDMLFLPGGLRNLQAAADEMDSIKEVMEILKDFPADMKLDTKEIEALGSLMDPKLIDAMASKLEDPSLWTVGKIRESLTARLAEVQSIMDQLMDVFHPQEITVSKEVPPGAAVTPTMSEDLREYIRLLQQKLDLERASAEERAAMMRTIEVENAVKEAQKIAQRDEIELTRETENQIRAIVQATQEQIETNRRNTEALKAANDEWKNLQSAADKVKQSIKTVNERYYEQVQLLHQLREVGLITWDEMQRGIEKAGEELDDMKKESDESFKELEQAVQGFGRGFSRTMAEMVIEGKMSFRELALSFLTDFVEAVIHTQFTKPLINTLMDAFSGGLSSSTAASVNTGSSRNIIAPDLWNWNQSPATSSPLGKATEGGTVVQVINNTGQSATVQKSTGADGTQMTKVIIGEVARDIARGGDLHKTLSGIYDLKRKGR